MNNNHTRGHAAWGLLALLPLLAGCGGGSGPGLAPQTGGSGETRRSVLTRFDVNVTTGKVTISSDKTKSVSTRAILTGGAVTFTSSDLISVPGDAGKRLLTLRARNNSGESIGENPRLIITGLQNKGSVNARALTTVSNFAGDGTTVDKEGFATAAGIASPSFITLGKGQNSTRLFATTGTHTVRAIQFDGGVSTFAGKSGTSGFLDGFAGNARFKAPNQIATDQNGTMYVADTGNNAIRRISPDGAVTTIAGTTGAAGTADGAGNVATFTQPVGIAVTPDGGRIYVTDYGSHTVRLLTYNKNSNSPAPPRDVAYAYTVQTIAGSAGTPGYSDGEGTNARLSNPIGLTMARSGFGGDTLYMADTGNNSIRVVEINSTFNPVGKVSTIAGTGAAGAADGTGLNATFNGPVSVAVQPNFDNSTGVDAVILVTDSTNQRVRALVLPAAGDFRTASDYRVVTLAGDGTAGNVNGDGTVARFNGPFGIALVGGSTPASTAYVADSDGNRIRKVVYSSLFLASTGPDSAIAEPVRLVNGTAEVAGEAAAWVRPINVNLNQGTDLQFFVPQGVSGFSFVAYLETDTGLINVPAIGAGFVTTLGGDGRPGDNEGPGKLAQFNGPLGITAAGSGYYATYQAQSNLTPRAFVADAGNNRIRILTPTGQFTTFAGSSRGFVDGRYSGAQFNNPLDVAINPTDSCLYVADAGNRAIRRIAPDGTVTTIAGTGVAGSADGSGATATFDVPRGITVDEGGTVFVADQARHVVRRVRFLGGNAAVAAAWQVTTIAGLAGTPGSTNGTGTAARFNVPCGLFCDKDGRVYVADAGNNTIRILTRTAAGGTYAVSTFAGTAGAVGTADGTGAAARFSSPTGVTADTAHNLYVADFGNNRIRRISPLGVVTTLMGSGAGFLNGGNGLFNGPAIIAVENAGTLLITDYKNHSVRTLQRLVNDAQNL